MGRVLSGEKRNRRGPRLGALMVTTALAVTGAAGYVHAQEQANGASAEAQQIRFDIPPQPLTDALTLFGRQSGMQVSADAGLLRDRSSPGVSGTMSPADALAQLLAGTGVAYRLTDGKTAMLYAAGSADGAILLGPVRVGGEEYEVVVHMEVVVVVARGRGGQQRTSARRRTRCGSPSSPRRRPARRPPCGTHAPRRRADHC